MKCNFEMTESNSSGPAFVVSQYNNCTKTQSFSFTPNHALSDEPLWQEDGCMVPVSVKTKYVYLGNVVNTKSDKQTTLAVKKIPKEKQEDVMDEAAVILWSPSNVTLGWKTPFHRGSGLTNLGNSCYLNSSLQALFHIPSFANWLLEDYNGHSLKCNKSSQYMSYCSVCSMMETLRLTLDRSNTTIRPILIQNRLRCLSKSLCPGRQEDAHEFIKMLLGHMEKSYLISRRATKLEHLSKETTPLNQVFGGYLKQQVICPECHYRSTTFSHFQDLALDIRNCSSVEDALSTHFRSEVLDCNNTYKCEKCSKNVNATKRHIIEKPPPVLLLQLKRFTASGGKIGKHIRMPERLNMNRYISGAKQLNQKTGYTYSYRLVSMVIHIGSYQGGGHYIAIARASNGTMFEYDDSRVQSVSEDSVMSKNPYLLFYELVEKPNTPITGKEFINKSIAESVSNGKAIPNDLKKKDLSPLPLKQNREKITILMKPVTVHGKNGQSSSQPSLQSLSRPFSKVMSWDGDKSVLGSQIDKDRSKMVQQTESDRYNDEFDTGKVSKKKIYTAKPSSSENPFQTFQRNKESQHSKANDIFKKNPLSWESPTTYRPHNSFKSKYSNNNNNSNNKSWKLNRPHPYQSNNRHNGYKNGPHKSWHNKTHYNSKRKDLYA